MHRGCTASGACRLTPIRRTGLPPGCGQYRPGGITDVVRGRWLKGSRARLDRVKPPSCSGLNANGPSVSSSCPPGGTEVKWRSPLPNDVVATLQPGRVQSHSSTMAANSSWLLAERPASARQ